MKLLTTHNEHFTVPTIKMPTITTLPQSDSTIEPAYQRRYQMRDIQLGDGCRQSVETHISETYAKIFNAKLSSFLPNLVADLDPGLGARSKVRSAFGYSDASVDRLFLENYLDCPIEALLSNAMNEPVSRHEIAEVGNLAVSGTTDSANCLLEINYFLQQRGYKWIVCTATRYLRVLMLKSGVKPTFLTLAESTRVHRDGSTWGSYYDTAPEILVGKIQNNISGMERKQNRTTVSLTSQC